MFPMRWMMAVRASAASWGISSPIAEGSRIGPMIVSEPAIHQHSVDRAVAPRPGDVLDQSDDDVIAQSEDRPRKAIDLFLWNAELLESYDQVADKCVELAVRDVQMLVGIAHAGTRVGVRATGDGGDHRALVSLEAREVHPFEVVVDAFVGEHLSIEEVHRGPDCISTADPVIRWSAAHRLPEPSSSPVRPVRMVVRQALSRSSREVRESSASTAQRAGDPRRVRGARVLGRRSVRGASPISARRARANATVCAQNSPSSSCSHQPVTSSRSP